MFSYCDLTADLTENLGTLRKYKPYRVALKCAKVHFTNLFASNKNCSRLELDRQETFCETNTLCPEPCSSSTYYEESTLYNENSEPCIERCKNIKTKHPCSPVEIRQESTVNIDLPFISWHNYGSIPKILNVINTGRTVLINGQWTKSRPYITGGPLNGNYTFSQIHFHSPSEHEINGKRYPLEMHVVHYKTSYLTQERAMEEKDGTVVIVYLFEVLQTDSSVLSSITNSIHLIEAVNDRTELTDVALNQILQPVFSNYYIYWGSVSTSKNSYLLQWIISCTNLCVTRKEMDKLIKILCSNKSFVESQASQMNIINNIIYHVEGYGLPLEVNRSGSNVMLKCYCRYHCQNCKICMIHQEEYLQFHITEPHFFGSKELGTRDKESQTFSCEKTAKATSKLSLRDCKQIQKEIMKCVEILSVSSCSSLNSNSNSKSSTCEDKKKKTKNKKSSKKALNSKNSNHEKEIIIELKTCSSCLSKDENLKTNSGIKSKKVKENDRKAKSKKVQKSETSSCETLKSSSKVSQKNSKIPSKKKVTKNTSEDKGTDSSSKSNRIDKKEKHKSKQKKATKSESSADSSKNSEGGKQEKKKKGDNEDENCDSQVEVQCLPVLVSTDVTEERLFEVESNFLEENKKEEKMEESKKAIEKLLIVCEKPLEPLKDVSAEKTSIFSELNDNPKTILEKKEVLGNSAFTGNDYAINFLLSPNTLQSKCSPLTSESECLEVAKNVHSNHSIAVNESMNKVAKLDVSSIESLEQWKEIYFEMEHLFRTERKGDFATCFTQEYNVAIVCNHNIIQEFRGMFHPNELKLGIYEKLPLVPKYPEPENESVRLDDCFIKKENVNQLYIRAKFLLNKAKINGITTESKNIFEEKKLPDSELSEVKNNQPEYAEEEKLQRDNEAGNKNNSNQSDLKTEVLEYEEAKVELLKKPGSDSKQSSKNIAFDCLQQSFELKKEEEKKENNLIEKSDKTIKDLFHKRKKVYFSCEKIEKDENSGKKVLVGSFRTKKEIRALSKDEILDQEADTSSLTEKSVGIDKKKSLSPCGKSCEKLVKSEKSKHRSQSPAKCSESNKSDESKNLITLHKHKPKN